MKAKHFLIAALSVVGILIFGILGWIIGALIGGNMADDFVYQGLPGYEGTGMLGSHIGAVFGFFVISAVLWRKFQKNTGL
jgi:hypothetical protein